MTGVLTARAGGGVAWDGGRCRWVLAGLRGALVGCMIIPGRMHKGGGISSWIICISPQSIDIATFFSQLNIDKMVILFNTMPAVCN